MSKLTIDQILSEEREKGLPVFALEKDASAQPPKSSAFSDEEVEKMASLLIEADFPEQQESFNEKIAAALILSDTINSLVKEASYSSPKEEVVVADDEEIKLAHFIDSAVKDGYSIEEIDEFLEKKAAAGSVYRAVKNLASKAMKSRAAKGAAGLSAVGGAGAVGHEVGKSKEREKAKKVMPKIFQMGATKGYKSGTERGFRAGVFASNSAWKKHLAARSANKDSK